MEIAWSNGNLISGSVISTQASAEVSRNGEDVTGEYAASAFAWKRDSGNAGADNTWNAAHAGKKAITLTAADLSGDVKISCTLTGSGATYGSITVDENMYASHTPGGLDANDVFAIANGELKVTTSRGEVYALQDGEVKGAGAKLNGTITAQSRLFASQPEDVVEFAYDHNGLRTQKKVTKADGTVETTDYTLHGKLVTHLTRGSDEMHFFYDGQRCPNMVEFNGVLYSYVHNLQGDIVGILDNAGKLVVEYRYDAWGKPALMQTLTTTYDVLAELNPFRYRGYVWDEEMGLYYLRSRYFRCFMNRFLSADVLLMRNLTAYCSNNPIRLVDMEGNRPEPTPSPCQIIEPTPSRSENWDTTFFIKQQQEIIVKNVKKLVSQVIGALKDFYMRGRALSLLESSRGGTITFKNGLSLSFYKTSYANELFRQDSAELDEAKIAKYSFELAMELIDKVPIILRAASLTLFLDDITYQIHLDKVNSILNDSSNIGVAIADGETMPSMRGSEIYMNFAYAWEESSFISYINESFGEIESVDFF